MAQNSKQKEPSRIQEDRVDLGALKEGRSLETRTLIKAELEQRWQGAAWVAGDRWLEACIPEA